MEEINEEHFRIHTHADGTTHSHSHNHDHEHNHFHHHDPAKKKAVINRISKAQGHLDYVKKMINNDEDCSDVLVQLSAVISALNGAGKAILKDHIEHCVVEAVENDEKEVIENLNKAIDKFLR